MLEFFSQPTRTQRWLGRGLLLIALVLVSYFVFSQPVGTRISIPNLDKISHFGAFLGLASLLQLASGLRRRWQMVWLTAYAALIEVVQYFLPYRSAEWLDLGADLAGALTFYLILLLVQQWPRRLPS
ncbi:VanZ family protein [Ferrimonas lipolytica]|uniref:VanZ family protein n=1 Tax=Ferrimonas lipolytica TaxID=2724191 RepID=A0A6H1UAH9_9GAMM|nr:VanZ family protein [Ferrimonas lipolytica]QIZ75590.1 VanZ family protein [Ferrimonas lipolytica]